MINEKINLKSINENLQHDSYLISYCPDNYLEWSNEKLRKCVVILPGGGYEFCSDREAEPIALRLAGNNIACFVLKYTLAPILKYPYPFNEVLASIAYIRKNYQKYHIDPNSISVMGFSAGGHLAGMSCVLQNDECILKALNLNKEDVKINGCILGYPVISTVFGHRGTIKNCTCNNPEMFEDLSIEKRITPDFPKTFIWHTSCDGVVNVKNSLMLATELTNNNVFYEMHIYPVGQHGGSLCDDSVYNDHILNKEQIREISWNCKWIDNAIHFIKEYL